MSQNDVAKHLLDQELEEGLNPSNLAEVQFFQTSCPFPRTCMIYEPGICVLVQGYKDGFLGGEEFRYGESVFLIIGFTLPFECECPSQSSLPVLGFYVSFDWEVLVELINQMDPKDLVPPEGHSGHKGLGFCELNQKIIDAAHGLVQCASNEKEAKVLGKSRLKEFYFRILQSDESCMLYELIKRDSKISHIAKSVIHIRENLACALEINDLAHRVHMSPSVYHKAFKTFTGETPIQFIKKTRLAKAREHILSGIKAYEAANCVGYKSISQFSREFKRQYGILPSEIQEK